METEPHDISGDFVRVATCNTPTEAYLLRGVLESAGLAPQVADANIVQANNWMTPAMGGVRVLVPASQVAAAKQAMAEFEAGAYQLDGEVVTAPEHVPNPHPVFSPDFAALLSFALTPAFGCAVQMANAASLGDTSRRTRQWLWLLFLLLATAAATVVLRRLSPGPMILFNASLALTFITAVWYFAEGTEQSRSYLATYGPRYTKKSLAKPAIGAALAMLALGWAMVG